MKAMTCLMAGLVLTLAGSAWAQRQVSPVDLRTNPMSFRNAGITVTDSYVPARAGITEPMAKSGYTLDKYVAFGLRETRIPCFARRGSAAAEKVAGLKPGMLITVTGTVRQPVAKVKRGPRDRTERIKLERVLIEVSAIELGPAK